jgi:hypothetical protein
LYRPIFPAASPAVLPLGTCLGIVALPPPQELACHDSESPKSPGDARPTLRARRIGGSDTTTHEEFDLMALTEFYASLEHAAEVLEQKTIPREK